MDHILRQPSYHISTALYVSTNAYVYDVRFWTALLWLQCGVRYTAGLTLGLLNLDRTKVMKKKWTAYRVYKIHGA
jgi:hypothetical protein